MSADFLAANWPAWSLQVLVLSSTACAAARLLRISEPKSRLIGAQMALFVCVLFPFAAPRAFAPRGTVSTSGYSADRPVGGRRIPVRRRSPWELAVPGLLAAGAAVRLMLLSAGMWKLRSYLKSARALEPLPPAVTAAFALTGTRCRVAISEHAEGPAACGFLDPLILLPASFLEMPLEAQRAIVCHELLHVRRKDWLWAFGEEIAGALLWFQPAVYLLLADIRLAREKVVDRGTVELTCARESYVRTLLAVASEALGLPMAIAPPFLRRRNLKSRIAFLIEELNMSKTKLIYANISLAALLCGAGWVSMVSFPLVAAQEKSSEQKEASAAADDFDFSKTFPAPAGKRIRVGGNAASKNLISQVRPAYPAQAKDARVQGKVRIGVLISPEGHIEDLALISGDPLLAPAATDAVRQWVYRPFLLNGQPVEVVSIVDVNFTLAK
jgi:TonB family protein